MTYIASKNALEAEEDRASRLQADFTKGVTAELENKPMQKFASHTDLIYSDAWWMHNSGFSTNNRLLSNDASLKIYDSIKIHFPLHYLVSRTIIFPKAAHKPGQRGTRGYQEKIKSLVNHLCALI